MSAICIVAFKRDRQYGVCSEACTNMYTLRELITTGVNIISMVYMSRGATNILNERLWAMELKNV